MPDKYYSKDEINKRITERLKPPTMPLMQRLRDVVKRRRLPRLPK